MYRGILYCLIACLSLTYPAISFSDSLGIETLQLLRQQMRDEERKKQQEKIPDVHYDGLEAAQDAGRLPKQESPCFVIHQFTLSEPVPGQSAGQIAGQFAGQFEWAMAAINPPDDPATGKCLGTTGVNRVIKRVQNALIARGFVTTRVMAEPQQLATGILTLSVIPGVISNIIFVHEANDRARYGNALPAQPGALLELRDIEHALENFKRLPTVEADIKMRPQPVLMQNPARVIC